MWEGKREKQRDEITKKKETKKERKKEIKRVTHVSIVLAIAPVVVGSSHPRANRAAAAAFCVVNNVIVKVKLPVVVVVISVPGPGGGGGGCDSALGSLADQLELNSRGGALIIVVVVVFVVVGAVG